MPTVIAKKPGKMMEPNQQIKWGYAGVVVTLLVGIMAATTSSESGFPLTIMISSLGMLNVCNLAQANDPTFLQRNRVILFLIVGGLAIPPPIYLGRKILEAEEWGVPYEIRILAFVILFAVTVGCAFFGIFGPFNHSPVKQTDRRQHK